MEKGAAEEPEPEPGEPPSTTAAAAAMYDPREYQPAHPDDRGGGGGKKSTKGKSKAEANEREKYALAAKARTERQQVLTMRRGVVALALRTAVRREGELCLSRAVARWAAVATLMAAAPSAACSWAADARSP